MKTLALGLFLIIVALPLQVFAVSGSATFVFKQISSAVASAPNLRIGVMAQPLARDSSTYSGASVQTFVRDKTLNYYLTKSTTVPLDHALYLVIQVDQPTYIYRNGDLTNYLLCTSGAPCYEGIR